MKEFVSGKWFGEYVYGAGYEPGLIGKRVTFEMVLSEQDSLITGYCIDEETKHLFKNGSAIEGIIEGGKLQFYKTYPFVYELDEKGVAYISEYVTPPSIQYTGWLKKKWFSSKVYLKGSWELHGAYIAANGPAQYYALEGTWKMARSKV